LTIKQPSKFASPACTRNYIVRIESETTERKKKCKLKEEKATKTN
jgi:hypothetical protein